MGTPLIPFVRGFQHVAPQKGHVVLERVIVLLVTQELHLILLFFGDAHLGGPVRKELRNVRGSDEQCLELRSQIRDEGPVVPRGGPAPNRRKKLLQHAVQGDILNKNN